jgi:hypothetical protein
MSPQKHAAQIANALRSSGPRTEAGKERSSRNSTRHGFCAEHYIVPAKDRDRFDRYYAEMMEALAPEGAIEMQLAEAIVTDQFRLMRIKNVENEIFVEGNGNAKYNSTAGAETWAARCKELALLTLYEQRINRTLTRNKQELEAKQAARRVTQQSEPAQPEISEAPVSKPITGAAAPAVGFVHSTEPVHPDPQLAEPPKSAPEVSIAA